MNEPECADGGRHVWTPLYESDGPLAHADQCAVCWLKRTFIREQDRARFGAVRYTRMDGPEPPWRKEDGGHPLQTHGVAVPETAEEERKREAREWADKIMKGRAKGREGG